MPVGHCNAQKLTNNLDSSLSVASSRDNRVIEGSHRGRKSGRESCKLSKQEAKKSVFYSQKVPRSQRKGVSETAKPAASLDLNHVQELSQETDTSIKISPLRSKKYMEHFSKVERSIQQVIGEEYGVTVCAMRKEAKECLLSAMLEKLDGGRSILGEINGIHDCKNNMNEQSNTKPVLQEFTNASQEPAFSDQASVTGEKRLRSITSLAPGGLYNRRVNTSHPTAQTKPLREVDLTFTAKTVSQKGIATASIHYSTDEENFQSPPKFGGNRGGCAAGNSKKSTENLLASNKETIDGHARVFKPSHESQEIHCQSGERKRRDKTCNKSKCSWDTLVGFETHEPSVFFTESALPKLSFFEELNSQGRSIASSSEDVNHLSGNITDSLTDEEDNFLSDRNSKVLQPLNGDLSDYHLPTCLGTNKGHKNQSRMASAGYNMEKDLYKWPMHRPGESFNAGILRDFKTDPTSTVLRDASSAGCSLPWVESEDLDNWWLHHIALPDDIRSYSSDSQMKVESTATAAAASEDDFFIDVSQSDSDLMAISVPSLSEEITACNTGFGSPITEGSMMSGIEDQAPCISSQDFMSTSELGYATGDSKGSMWSRGSKEHIDLVNFSEELPDTEMHENLLSPANTSTTI